MDDMQQVSDGLEALMVFLTILWGLGIMFGVFLSVLLIRALLCVPKILEELRVMNHRSAPCSPEELKFPYS